MALNAGREKPLLILAPMAGVTDLAFRTVCAELGADVTVTEMVSSRALVYQDRKSAALLKRTPGPGLCGAQIFGSEPEIMAEAARLALARGAFDFIDINMGCPVPKIAGNGDGSALMRDPDRAARIVGAVAAAVAVPVTVKTRKGWDKSSVNVVEFAKRLQDAGAAALAVHGRTKTMGYSGAADWDIIAKVRDALSIPVAANGDINSPEAAVRCAKRTRAGALMLGRAVFGDPWLFPRARAALAGEPVPPRPPLFDRVETALRQFELAREDKGERIACLEARRHFAWYLRGVPYGGYYKEKLSSAVMAEDVYAIARGIQRDLR